MAQFPLLLNKVPQISNCVFGPVAYKVQTQSNSKTMTAAKSSWNPVPTTDEKMSTFSSEFHQNQHALIYCVFPMNG